MKKMNIFTLILCALLLSGCGSSSVSTPTSEPTSSKIDIPESSSNDISIKIANWRIGKYDDKDVLIIEYEWTNNSDKAKSFVYSVNDKVFQNGIECATPYGYSEIDTQKQLAEIKPGITYNVEAAYILQDKTAASVELTDFLGSTMYLHQVIDLGGGSSTISSPPNVETSIEVTGVHLSEDYKGDTVLIVDYKFTNGENSPKAFMYLFRAKAFQHGVECNDTVVGCDDEIDGSRWLNEVQPGVTYTVSMGYHISDFSDVEINVTDFMGNELYYTANVDFPDEEQSSYTSM